MIRFRCCSVRALARGGKRPGEGPELGVFGSAMRFYRCWVKRAEMPAAGIPGFNEDRRICPIKTSYKDPFSRPRGTRKTSLNATPQPPPFLSFLFRLVLILNAPPSASPISFRSGTLLSPFSRFIFRCGNITSSIEPEFTRALAVFTPDSHRCSRALKK